MSSQLQKTCFIIIGKEAELERMIVSLPVRVQRCGSLAEARPLARKGDSFLVLADRYPEATVTLSDHEWDWLKSSGCRSYIEFPTAIPGLGEGVLRKASRLERGWMTSDRLIRDALVNVGAPLLSVYPGAEAWMRIGKVAGYDRLAFEIGETPTDRLLFPVEEGFALVAATPLSGFVSSRFSPHESWRILWSAILGWLLDAGMGVELPEIAAVCRPLFAPADEIPDEAALRAVRRSLQWFDDAGMLLSAEHEALYGEGADDGCFDDGQWAGGDGSGGVLEGYLSEMDAQGRQPVRWWRRADCVLEVAGAFALGGMVTAQEEKAKVAQRLNDWLFNDSAMVAGERNDPDHPAYGLIGWHDRAKYGRFNLEDGWNIFYGDDNARGLLGMIASAGALKDDRWLRRMIRCILSNLRTSGPHGLRRNAIWISDLERRGWRGYAEDEALPAEWISPHYQCYLSACYLWLYQQVGDPMLLEYAVKGLTVIMENYPARWRWTNGLQQERARMLLPLAWLVRVSDDPLHHSWLEQIAVDLLEHQQPCGALREVLAEGNGKYGPPKRHEDYGTQEAALLQCDGDPVSDLLYTCNFAFLGLHEAAAATGKVLYVQASDRLAEFLIRIQTQSARPELSGLWYRTFDYRRWEAWGSDADGAWGAWCVETGWTQAWITSVLAMREEKLSLWEIYQPADAEAIYKTEKQALFGCEAVSVGK